ncbi:lectin [Solimonas fluminis]|uniref:Lectin n=1 Tax=Solimonas fluminis TaxID=2086571 RepID=A0A2S5TLM2_9GAMM|nr:lectin [Solimonas fluminis]PPE75883.1 lectin [Solimonas fluminis]
MKPAIILLAAAAALSACQRGSGENSPPVDSAPEPAAVAPEPPKQEETVGFRGFGPAHFGDGEAAVRLAWGRPLKAAGSEPGSCLQLFPDPAPARGFGTSFMLVEGRFARFDVDEALFPAPGGGRVGSSAQELQQHYGGRIEEVPHKYVAGAKYYIVRAPEGGEARLIFEVSPEGRVQRWRIGLPPAVDYVEGCS